MGFKGLSLPVWFKDGVANDIVFRVYASTGFRFLVVLWGITSLVHGGIVGCRCVPMLAFYTLKHKMVKLSATYFLLGNLSPLHRSELDIIPILLFVQNRLRKRVWMSFNSINDRVERGRNKWYCHVF